MVIPNFGALGFAGPKRVPKKRPRSALLPRAVGPGPGSPGAAPGPGSRGAGPGLGRGGGSPGYGWGDLKLIRLQRPGTHRVAGPFFKGKAVAVLGVSQFFRKSLWGPNFQESQR